MNTKRYIMMILALVWLAGCSKSVNVSSDSSSSTSPDSGSSTEEVGYLSFSFMELFVDQGEEVINNNIQQSSAVTRTTTDLDNYIIEIISEKDGSQAYKDSYSAVQELEAKSISLSPGTYTILVRSVDVCSAAAWETPYYEGSQSGIVITSKNTTDIADAIICTLSNIKISVSINPSMLNLFDDSEENPLNINISIGEGSLDFSRTEEQAAYFRADEESNTMTISISGLFNTGSDAEPEWLEITDWQEVRSGIKAGEWRQILLKVNSAYEGTVEFEVQIETYVYNELIDVDIADAFYNYTAGEESIIDPDDDGTHPDAPVVAYANGQSIDSVYVIDDNSFNFDFGYATAFLSATVSPLAESTVETLTANISSTNSAIGAAISAAGFNSGSVDLLSSEFANFAVINTDASTGVVTLTLNNNTMFSLYEYTGTHTVVVTATDSEGRRSISTLTINVVGSSDSGSDDSGSSSDALTVVWEGGYSFDERYTVDDDLEVVIVINSKTGLTGLTVDIDSEVLNEEELNSVNLSTSMDLVNPATPEMETNLQGFEFPTGDDVVGLKELTLDITGFMGLLVATGSDFTVDFTLTVSDASGSVSKTIKLYVE